MALDRCCYFCGNDAVTERQVTVGTDFIPTSVGCLTVRSKIRKVGICGDCEDRAMEAAREKSYDHEAEYINQEVAAIKKER